MLLLRPALKLFRDSISTFDLMIQRSTFLRTNCRWPDSNRHGPFKAQRILSPLRLPFRHIGFYLYYLDLRKNSGLAGMIIDSLLTFSPDSGILLMVKTTDYMKRPNLIVRPWKHSKTH